MQDVDGSIPFVDASDVVAEIQRERGLDADWFNGHAQGLQPPVAGPDMRYEAFREGSVVLMAAKAEAPCGWRCCSTPATTCRCCPSGTNCVSVRKRYRIYPMETDGL